jgi:uncharacterized protein (TIGR03118 family)
MLSFQLGNRLIASFLLLSFIACSKDDTTNPPATTSVYEKTYLVTDESGAYGSAIIDTNLVNGWGLAVGSTGYFWVSAEGTGLSTVYNKFGSTQLPPVTIPSRSSPSGGAPTGVVYNHTTDFVIPSMGAAVFIFASEDGSVSAWAGGLSATRVYTSPSEDGAAYLGLALGASGGQNYLYIANFAAGKIEVLDKNFTPVSGMSFTDPSLPTGYAPFNIANINGKLYVTYAKQGADNEEETGVGLGFVSIFNTDGSFVKRFASQGTLNAPWGIALAHDGFGDFKNAILVGNFGDGTISGFDANGTFIDQLRDNDGNLVKIDGLWGIMFTDATSLPAIDPNLLWFAAGPDDEEHGSFGYVQLK